jgi:hypothetical protein
MTDTSIALADDDGMPTAIVKVVRLLDTHKALAAFFAPLVIATLTTLGNWVVTGNFDATELRIEVGGVISSAASGLAAYYAPAGNAVGKLDPGSMEIDPDDGNEDFIGTDDTAAETMLDVTDTATDTEVVAVGPVDRLGGQPPSEPTVRGESQQRGFKAHDKYQRSGDPVVPPGIHPKRRRR